MKADELIGAVFRNMVEDEARVIVKSVMDQEFTQQELITVVATLMAEVRIHPEVVHGILASPSGVSAYLVGIKTRMNKR